MARTLIAILVGVTLLVALTACVGGEESGEHNEGAETGERSEQSEGGEHRRTNNPNPESTAGTGRAASIRKDPTPMRMVKSPARSMG